MFGDATVQLSTDLVAKGTVGVGAKAAHTQGSLGHGRPVQVAHAAVESTFMVRPDRTQVTGPLTHCFIGQVDSCLPDT